MPAISLGSRSSRAALAAGAAVTVFLGLTFVMRLKDATTPAAKPAPAASAAVPALDAPDTRHEAMALEAQLQKKPDHVPILFRLAQIAREKGKPADAISYLRKIVEVEPANADARLELGRSLYDTGDVAGAIEQTNRILAADPKHVDALYNLGAIYANSGKPQLAAEYWKRAAASDPASESGQRAAAGLQRLSGAN